MRTLRFSLLAAGAAFLLTGCPGDPTDAPTATASKPAPALSPPVVVDSNGRKKGHDQPSTKIYNIQVNNFGTPEDAATDLKGLQKLMQDPEAVASPPAAKADHGKSKPAPEKPAAEKAIWKASTELRANWVDVGDRGVASRPASPWRMAVANDAYQCRSNEGGAGFQCRIMATKWEEDGAREDFTCASVADCRAQFRQHDDGRVSTVARGPLPSDRP